MMPQSQVGPMPVTQQPQMMMMQPVMMTHGMVPQMMPQQGAALVPGYPQGLECLAHADTLIIKQKVELLEAFTGFETANKYEVKTPQGQTVLYAAEQSGCCVRCCCGRGRPFRMSIVDTQQREVLSLQRPLRCQGCCCPCCLQEMEVSAGGVAMGKVTEEWSLFYPSFSVRGPGDDVRLQIHGPLCVCKCCSDVDFPVMSADGNHQVGNLTKQWGGMTKEVFTDAKTFAVKFPQGLDAATKTTLFGAAFLIGYMYFERDGNGG